MTVRIGVKHAKDKVGMNWCMAGMKSPAKESRGKKQTSKPQDKTELFN